MGPAWRRQLGRRLMQHSLLQRVRTCEPLHRLDQPGDRLRLVTNRGNARVFYSAVYLDFESAVIAQNNECKAILIARLRVCKINQNATPQGSHHQQTVSKARGVRG